MRKRINPKWADQMREAIAKSKHPSNPEPFEPIVLSWNKSAQWLISRIAESGQVPSVENLGAGVKRIGIKGTCCPTCGAVN